MLRRSPANRRTAVVIAAAMILAFTLGRPANAELAEVRISQQYGLTFLPLIVARHEHFIEQRAAALGLKDLKVTWIHLGGGAATNDALISGSVEFASAGLGPLLTLWDKTRSGLGVHAVAALDASAVFLNVNRPDLKTLADLRDTDRIALPAVKVSHQSILLQMATAKAFGQTNYDRFDKLTVTLAHPDALAALLSNRTEITGHFGNSPFIYQELDDPRVHRLLSSEEILGGAGTITSLFTTAKVRNDNPKLYHAILDALDDAQALIARDKAKAAQIYVEEEKGPLDSAAIQKLLEQPTAHYSGTPLNTYKFADFMAFTGALKTKPDSWRDYYFPEIHDRPGS